MGDIGTVGWIEIGTADPGATAAFYGELLGWTFADGAPAAGFGYRDITPPGATRPIGGLLDTAGAMPGYAVFVLTVADVAATCADAARLGGTVDAGPLTLDTGLTCAYLSDPDGNRFAVFTPPAMARDGAG